MNRLEGSWAESARQLLDQLSMKSAVAGESIDCVDLLPVLKDYLLQMEDLAETP